MANATKTALRRAAFQDEAPEQLRSRLQAMANGWAFACSPLAARFAAIDPQGRLLDETGGELALETLFELTAFTETCHLNCVRDGLAWRGVELTEREGGKPVDPINGRRLLWGEVEHASDAGWTRLSSHRTGPLWIPAMFSRGDAPQGVSLRVREYAAEGPHGNMAVIAERWTGFEATPQHTETTHG